MRRSARRAVAALATGTTFVAALAAVGPSAAGTPAPPIPVGAVAGDKPERWVTLISGDRVQVGSDGEVVVAPQKSAIRVNDSFARYQRGGDRYVMPADAAKLVRAGLVDEQLFNVTGLVRQGYDDASSKVVPLLVQYADAKSSGRAKTLAGAKPKRRLSKLALTANDVGKNDTRKFWAQLLRQVDPGTKSLTGGVRKVWLNGRYQASLDRSVAQIGAPQAWQAGYTGRDVTVAVLDTGYDPGHPDLAGKVATAKDFSTTGHVQDVQGHGTHVASIVAGNGATSGGTRRGVAPDARLAVGKVLGDDGFGQEDALLAGMEWAATEVRAKVVNMSLGGAGDGTGPVDLAVNRLSADYGTLFVAAAGNAGPVPVLSPASADAALAVGSVTRLDTLSSFSNHGPRPGDGLAKPELVAPGENIVAARAAGAFPEIIGEASQVPLSGTSMAAPHVAGAAAILAQQHPDWAGDQLKAALTASAAPVGDAGVFQAGAGRVDVARAVGQRIQAVPATLATRLTWNERQQKRPLTVRYHNSGTSPVTLTLRLALTDPAGAAAPPGLVTLDDSVTIPAGGQASTQLTIKGQPDHPGTYGGVLIGTADGVTIRTPVTVRLDPEEHTLRVRAVGRDGAPDNAFMSVVNLDTDDSEYVYGDTDLHLPAGRYAVFGTLDLDQPAMVVQVGHPEVRLTGDTTITLDGRWASPVRLAVSDRPEARAGVRTVEIGAKSRADGSRAVGLVTTIDPQIYQVYAGSAPGVDGAQLRLADLASLERPTLELTATAPERFEVPASWLTATGQAAFTGRVELAAVAVPADTAGQAPPEAVAGKLVVLTGAEQGDPVSLDPIVRSLAAAGAKMVASGAPDLEWYGEPLALPTMWLGGPAGERLATLAATGALTTTVQGNPASPYRYVLAFADEGAIPQQLVHQASTDALAAVPTSYHGSSEERRWLVSQYKLGGSQFCVCRSVEVHGPLERMEYYTPGTWQVWNGRDGEPSLIADGLPLKTGGNAPLHWERAVAGPALGAARSSGRSFAFRDDNVITMDLPLLGDADGHWRRVDFTPNVTGSTSLYRNGQRLGTTQQPGVGTFALPGGSAEYRLATEAVLNAPNRLGTKIDVVWTFRSDTTSAPTALPLLGVGMVAPVDLHNSVRVGDENPVLITTHRQNGLTAPKITKIALEVSYDDGTTWSDKVSVDPDGQGWQARVPHHQRGFVSLRVKATDADQNSVVQTVLRAYQVS